MLGQLAHKQRLDDRTMLKGEMTLRLWKAWGPVFYPFGNLVHDCRSIGIGQWINRISLGTPFSFSAITWQRCMWTLQARLSSDRRADKHKHYWMRIRKLRSLFTGGKCPPLLVSTSILGYLLYSFWSLLTAWRFRHYFVVASHSSLSLQISSYAQWRFSIFPDISLQTFTDYRSIRLNFFVKMPLDCLSFETCCFAIPPVCC